MKKFNGKWKLSALIVGGILAAVALASCPSPSGNGDEKPLENVTQSDDGKTYIRFDNTQGVCTVIIYNDYHRRDSDIIEVVRAGVSSAKPIEWTAQSSYLFYFSYQFAVPGAEENTIIYTPSDIGKNQVAVRIDAGKVTTITIPKLEDTLSAQNELLSNQSYLIIQNSSSYSFRLMNWTTQITPENLGGAVVNGGERALYKLDGGAASSAYTLLVGADNVPFPANPAQFAAGYVYQFVYSGAGITAAQGGNTQLDVVTVTAQGAGGGTIPAAPAGLAVTGVTLNSVSLSWNAVSEASGYRVYRAASADGAFYQIGSRSATNATAQTPVYTDTGLLSGTAYYYKVSAVNAAGESAQSGAAEGRTTEPSVAPSTPTGLAVSGVTSTSIDLSWNTANGANGYKIYRAPSADGTFAQVGTSNINSYTDSGLSPNTAYYYKVSAVNTIGESAQSAAVEGTASGDWGYAPTIIASDGVFTLQWNAVGSAVNYEVYIGTDEARPAIPVKTVSGTTTVLTGLVNRTLYYVWVKAALSDGSSSLSRCAIAKPWSASEVPETPSSPAVASGTNQLTVSWQKVSGASSYQVFINTEMSIPATPAQITSQTNANISQASAVIAGLETNVIYYVWVRAVNSAGVSGYSPVESGSPNVPAGAPAAPDAPQIAAGNEQLTVTWTAVSGATAYEVWLGTVSNHGSAVKQDADVTELSKTITGLSNGATYYVWLKAKNSVAAGAFSTAASGVPLGNMGAVTLSAGAMQLTASWAAVAGAAQYEVYYSTSASMPASPAQTVTTTSATITGLTNGTTYYVWVKPKNSSGAGTVSATVSGVPDIVEPGLYKGASYETTALIGTQTLENALTYISSNAVSGDNYYIVLGADITMAAKTLSYSGKTVSITLMGYGTDRQINLSGTGALFTVSGSSGNEVTLVLDNNISLRGVASNTSALVCVSYYGKLIMKNGAKVFGNTNSDYSGARGGGVYVSDGTFTMSGGTISSNTASSYSSYGGGVYVISGTFTMSGGTISGNTASSSGGSYGGGVYVGGSGTTFTMSGGTINGNLSIGDGGGGVYVMISGTFTMSGGTISGNTAIGSYAYGGGVCANGTFIKSANSVIYGNDADVSLKNTASGSNGHAVYVSSSKKRNTTAGASVALDSSTAANWE
jgi:fibronectin type 3 domain-containing protein